MKSSAPNNCRQRRNLAPGAGAARAFGQPAAGAHPLRLRQGYRRSVADYAWSWLSGLLAPHKSLSAWMDAHQPDWRAGKTPAAVVYARSENGWFSWLIAELEAEINDPQARARRDARG